MLGTTVHARVWNEAHTRHMMTGMQSLQSATPKLLAAVAKAQRCDISNSTMLMAVTIATQTHQQSYTLLAVDQAPLAALPITQHLMSRRICT